MVLVSSILFPDTGGMPPCQAVCCFPTQGLKLPRNPLGGIPRGRNSNGTEKNINCPGPKSIFQKGGGEEYFRANSQRLRFFLQTTNSPPQKNALRSRARLFFSLFNIIIDKINPALKQCTGIQSSTAAWC